MTGNRIFVIFLIVLAAYLTSQMPWQIPRPTDDFFYIDAAWQIQNGTYQAPSPNAPYHHYLRWAVVLPLALSMKIFGMNQFALGVYQTGYFLALVPLLYALSTKAAIRGTARWFALFLPFMFPFEFLSPRALSEVPSLFWSLLALVFALFATNAGRTATLVNLLAAGGAAAIAFNATPVSIFSSLVPPLAVLLSNGHARRKAVASVLLPYASGFLVVLCVVMGAEWLFLGDPLLEYRSLFWWHFQLGIDRSENFWLNYISPTNRGRFIFGFLTALAANYPLIILLICTGAFLQFGPYRHHGFSRSMFICGGTSLLLLEIAGPFVISKEYLRFVTIPAFLLCLGSVTCLGEYMDKRALPHQSMRFAAPAVLLLLVLGRSTTNLRTLEPDAETLYFYTPIAAFQEHLEAHPDVQSARIFTEHSGVPGLMYFHWLIRGYTYYSLHDLHQVTAVDSDILTEPDVAYYLTNHPDTSKRLLARGFTEIRTAALADQRLNEFPLPRLRLYVRRNLGSKERASE